MGDGGVERERVLARQMRATARWLGRRRSVPRDVAEDAVQEALLQLVELSGQFWPENLGAWLRRVAERRLLDTDRRHTFPPTDKADAFPSPPVDLDEILAVRAALSTLSPSARAIVDQRMAGFSWREIASRERISEEAARKRFSRAILELERLVRPA